MATICTDNQSIIVTRIAPASEATPLASKSFKLPKLKFDLLRPVRQWVDGIEIRNAEMAEFLAKAIPAQCPFERDIILFGRKVGHIPPLCKLNPLYEELVGLRFRALCYLVDECGMDITSYC